VSIIVPVDNVVIMPYRSVCCKSPTGETVSIYVTASDESTVDQLHRARRAIELLITMHADSVTPAKPAVIATADLPETGATLPNDPVPSTAVVAPLPIAPVVGTATLDPQVAFAAPAPSPVPAAPTAAVPAPPAPPAPPVIVPVVPTLDKNGFPWDQRIHSSSKGINEDGTWRAKRGVDKGLVTTVEAELRQLMGIQLPLPIVSVPPPPPPPPPAPQTDPLLPFAPVAPPPAAEVPSGVTVSIPPAPTAVPSVPVSQVDTSAPPLGTVNVASPSSPVVVAPSMTFAGLIAAVMPRIAAGVLTKDQVNKVLGEFSIPALPLLASRPDMIPAVALALGL